MKLEKDIKNKINYIFDVLDKNKIKNVCVDFSGGGDDGNMEIASHDGDLKDEDIFWTEPTIFGGERYNYSSNKMEKSFYELQELILEVSEILLDYKGVYYANVNGNDGSICFDVKKKEINMFYQVTKEEKCVVKT